MQGPVEGSRGRPWLKIVLQLAVTLSVGFSFGWSWTSYVVHRNYVPADSVDSVRYAIPDSIRVTVVRDTFYVPSVKSTDTYLDTIVVPLTVVDTVWVPQTVKFVDTVSVWTRVTVHDTVRHVLEPTTTPVVDWLWRLDPRRPG